MTTITADRVGVTFGTTTILADVDVTVAAGDWLSLIGPNGAGKSTLLRALAGALDHVGAVELDGAAPSTLSHRELARRVAFVPQRPETPIGLNVTDYVLLGRTPYVSYLGTESAGDLDVVAMLLDQLDLARLAHRELTALSGGEFQRAVLARALAQQAPVLLLDEPTSALDIGHAQQVLELVDDLRRTHDLTVVTAMHDLTMAAQFADRLLLLADGRAVATGTPRQVLTRDAVAHHYAAHVRVVPLDGEAVAVVPLRNGRQTSRSSETS